MKSFYAFPDQQLALHNIAGVCRPAASLYIFDYARSRGSSLPIELGSDIGQLIIIEDMPSWLSQAGWAKVGLEDYTEPYVIWYDSLLRAFELDQKWIVETFGEEWR